MYDLTCNAACSVGCDAASTTLRGIMATARAGAQSFGAFLEKLMLRAGIWDTALARRLGASRSEVFRWRTGRAMPTWRNVERLQNALQWSSGGALVPLE